MGRLKPYSGTSLNRLVLEINRSNELHLVHGVDFLLSQPMAISKNNGHNTKVTFIPLVFNQGFKEQDISYRRLDIAVLDNLPSGTVKPVLIDTLPTSTHAILDSINEALGLDLVKEEVADNHYPPPEVLSTNYALTINENVSYSWIGSYDFKVAVDNKLSNVILSTSLGMVTDPFQIAEGSYDPEHELLRLISDANPGIYFEPGSLIFTDVTDIEPAENGFIRSQVYVEASPACGYYGGVLITYSRRDLSSFGDDLSIISELPITTEMVYEVLVDTALDTNINFTDLVPFTAVSGLVGDIGDIFIQASVTSLVWGGSVKIAYLYGLPFNVEKLHVCVNKTLPSPGYLL